MYNTTCSEVCLIEQTARDGFGVGNTLGVGLHDYMVCRQIYRKKLNKHGNIQRIGSIGFTLFVHHIFYL